MRHMRLNQMSRLQRGIQTQLSRQHTRRDNPREFPRVVARVRGMRATDAEEVEHSGLGLEDRAAAYGADFYGGHCDGDVEVAVYAVRVSRVAEGGMGGGGRTSS